MQIHFLYSPWFVVLCILPALLIAGGMYYKNSKADIDKKIKSLLFGLRFICVFTISFLLLGPLVETYFTRLEKPLLIIACDNSLSLSEIDRDYEQKLQKISAELENEFDLKFYSFGEKVQASFIHSYQEKSTDFSALFKEIQHKYSHRKTGAILLCSDGNFNRGIDPLLAYKELHLPLYTLALGDTTKYKDIRIKKLNINEYAFLNQAFPLNIDIIGEDLNKEDLVYLEIYENKQLIHKERIVFDKSRIFFEKTIYITPSSLGVKKYECILSSLKNEKNIQNNRAIIYTEIIDGKRKVAIIAAAPHPDIAAIRQAVLQNELYSCEAYLLKNFTRNIEDYSLVMLHQIPCTDTKGDQMIRDLADKKIPVLYLLGSRSDMTKFNALEIGLKINEKTKNLNESQAQYNQDFSLYNISEGSIQIIEQLPPLYSPFAEYRISPGFSTLFTQNIHSIKSINPLIGYNVSGDQRKGVIIGSGLYRWRSFNYMAQWNTQAFDELILQSVQVLSSRDLLKNLQIKAQKLYFTEESIHIEAKLRNSAMQAALNAKVSIEIIDSLQEVYTYSLFPYTDYYSVDIPYLAPGKYKYQAKAILGDQSYLESGDFEVSEAIAEEVSPRAEHEILHQLSTQYGGITYYPNNLENFLKDLDQSEHKSSLSYNETRFDDLIHKRYLVFMLLFFLCGEWLLRKWKSLV